MTHLLAGVPLIFTRSVLADFGRKATAHQWSKTMLEMKPLQEYDGLVIIKGVSNVQQVFVLIS